MGNVTAGDMATRGNERVRVLAVSGDQARVTGPRGEEQVATSELRYLPVAHDVTPGEVRPWAL